MVKNNIEIDVKVKCLEEHKTQADIARDLKLNKATVSSWMNGTRIPRIDSVDLLFTI